MHLKIYSLMNPTLLEDKVEKQIRMIKLLQWQLKESQEEVSHRTLF